METVRVLAGSIVVMRLYDVAYAIDLVAADKLVRATAAGGAHRLSLTRTEAKAVAFDVPPIQMPLGTTEATGADSGTGEVSARIYDFGAISIAIRFPVLGADWDDFVTDTNRIASWASSPAAADLWVQLRDRVRGMIGAALERPSIANLEEDYLLAVVNELDRPLRTEELLKVVDVAPLLSGESRPLSQGAQNDLLRHRYSYHEDDLAILTWDRAFIYEPSGDTDVADIIEIANAQLLELRYFDEILDDELPRMYDRVEEARRRLTAFSRGRYSTLARELHAVVADVTEIRERVDNALQVTEDVYLARIYGAAVEVFRTRAWAAAVDRKLAIIRDTYTTLFDEAASVRAELLEMAIVVMIAFEIVMSFLR